MNRIIGKVFCWFLITTNLGDHTEKLEKVIKVDDAIASFCQRCGAETFYMGPVNYTIKNGKLMPRDKSSPDHIDCGVVDSTIIDDDAD